MCGCVIIAHRPCQCQSSICWAVRVQRDRTKRKKEKTKSMSSLTGVFVLIGRRSVSGDVCCYISLTALCLIRNFNAILYCHFDASVELSLFS